MSESVPLAFFGDLREGVVFLLRLLLSLFGAWLGWILAKPVARGLCRLAFQRPIPDNALLLSRLAGAVGMAVLVFYLFPLALGGGPGTGPGGGTGPGTGQGSGQGTDKGGGKESGGKDDGKDTSKKQKQGGPYDPEKILRIDMIPSDRYQMDGRYYLVEGKEPPKSLAQVKADLGDRKGRIQAVEIVIYRNTPGERHTAVQGLLTLVRQDFPDLEPLIKVHPNTDRPEKGKEKGK
ncbi:MAG: hypothetical protein L0Z62_42175 [Gemmataceae bacterium]|nr:hypothetical protein [Gemmataceae bacterium]